MQTYLEFGALRPARRRNPYKNSLHTSLHIYTNYDLTYPQSSLSFANSNLPDREIRFFYNPRVHCRVHNSPPVDAPRVTLILFTTTQTSSSQSVTRDQFPGYPWIHFCNGYFEVFLFFNNKNNVLINIIAQLF